VELKIGRRNHSTIIPVFLIALMTGWGGSIVSDSQGGSEASSHHAVNIPVNILLLVCALAVGWEALLILTKCSSITYSSQ
jgi:hypothetical protein